MVVETTDILFAVDSIPAIFAITRDPFLVFTSNIFAIMGLRSLYFVLAAVLDMFKYVKYSLVFILAFVGVKMLITYFHIHIPSSISLVVILGSLAAGILFSWSSYQESRRLAEMGRLSDSVTERDQVTGRLNDQVLSDSENSKIR